MQSTHYLLDLGQKSASKHHRVCSYSETAPWFSRSLSKADSCRRLCTQAIVYCTHSSASQSLNPEKNEAFTSLPTRTNGPNVFCFVFFRKGINVKHTRELTWLWGLNCSCNTGQNWSERIAAWWSSTQRCSRNMTHRPWTLPYPCVVVIVSAPQFQFCAALQHIFIYKKKKQAAAAGGQSSIQHYCTPALSVSTWIYLFLGNVFPCARIELQISLGICLNKGEPANWRKKDKERTWIALLMCIDMKNT